jgi:hypothetical protein
MSGCQAEEEHNEEELAIESKLATLVPESVNEFPICRNSRRTRRNEIVMPKNSYEGLHPSRQRHLASRERKAGAEPNGLRVLLDIFYALGQLKTLRATRKRPA